jgi:hypothetical protein
MEGRVKAILFNFTTCAEHSLTGEHGRRVLEVIKAEWNSTGYAPEGRRVFCAGDSLSDTTRRKKHLTGRF